MTPSNVPGTFSFPRIVVLLASLLCALSSGTNYVYSAYAPQLGSRLHINHTLLNVVGLGGNIGMYLAGPFLGRFVDRKGPQIPLLIACGLLLTGYSGIRMIYVAGVPEGTTSLPTIKLVGLFICSFMTGVGGNAGMTAGINTAAKTFPEHVRGSTTGIVISGFGLSAFFFSTLSHIFTAGDTGSLLLLLSLGTSLPMILGFFLVRPIPVHSNDHIAHSAAQEAGEIDYAEVDAAALAPSVLHHHDNDSRTRLLTGEDEDAEEGRGSLELNNPATSQVNRRRRRSSSVRPMVTVEGVINVHGKKLFSSISFWTLCAILSLLSGTGLMYINNVGSMAQALYVHEAKNSTLSDADQVEIAKWQGVQVSTISFMNFSGRIIIGLLSDLVKARLGLPRSYLLVLVSLVVLLSQLEAASIVKLKDLWMGSALLGLGYGTVFSLNAALTVEWFGLAHFSENWGYLSLSPLLGGNLFSVAFGRNLDAHEKASPPGVSLNESEHLALPGPVKEMQCLEGRGCYVDSLRMTTVACVVAMLLSVWAAWRDKKRHEDEMQRLKNDRPEVIWEEEEES